MAPTGKRFGTSSFRADPVLNDLLHPRLPYTKAEVVWAARHEMARSVEDVLIAAAAGAALLDAWRASVEAAGKVARLLATELGHDSEWAETQVREWTYQS